MHRAARYMRPQPSAPPLQVWYNHLGVLHSASWADEFAHAARHLRSARYAALSWLFYALDALIHRGLFGEAFGQHVTHRGGEPIAAEHVWHVRRLMWKHTLTAPWRQGEAARRTLPTVGAPHAGMVLQAMSR